ncbi:MAG TPA: class F sortase [Candidatus Paceibacterota bacterium]|nr:class F sortase [Candidatus Paceibacterota bacterium]
MDNSNKHIDKSFWTKGFLLSLSVGLLVAGLSVFLQTREATVQAFSAATSALTAAAAAPAGLGSSFVEPGQPSRLIIPSIGVDAHVQSVGLYWNGDGTMSIPTNFTDVGWYNGGPLPGAVGSAVIDGHYDGRNVKEAVFYNLGKLTPGDLVEVVDNDGTTLKFQVVGVTLYDYNATTTDIFSGDTSEARLNLITCAGSWDKAQGIYTKRVVVFTKLIKNN